MRRFIGFAAALAAVAVLHGKDAAAGDGVFRLTVPDDYPTIQQAIDAAPKYSAVEIQVLSGTYRESVMISGFEDLTLTTSSHATIESVGDEAAVSMCTSQNVVIEGFDIASATVGVQIYNTRFTLLDHLDIESPGTYGVLAEGSAVIPSTTSHIHYGHPEVTVIEGDPQTWVSIQDSTIANAGSDAVRLGVHTRLNVENSTITAPREDGIHVIGREDSGVILVDGTTIADPAGDGIDAADVTLAVGATAITGAAGDGIVLRGEAVGTVSGTHVEQVGGDGFLSTEPARFDWIVQSTVRQTGGHGLCVTAGAVTDNRIAGTGGAGIMVLDGGTNVARNEIVRSRGDGICLMGRHMRGSIVEDNIVMWPDGDGVDAGAASRVQFLGNSVTGAAGCGFRLASHATRNQLVDNEATGSDRWDLWDGGARNLVAKSNHFGKRHRRRS